jgi:hypothetical protein
LKALRACCTFRRVAGDAVRVVFQRGFLVGIADLLLCGFGVDFEDFIVVWRGCGVLDTMQPVGGRLHDSPMVDM